MSDVPPPEDSPPPRPPTSLFRGLSSASTMSPGARAALQRVAEDVDVARAERSALYAKLVSDGTSAAAERLSIHQRMEASLARSQQLHDDLARDAASARAEREALRQQQEAAAAIADAQRRDLNAMLDAVLSAISTMGAPGTAGNPIPVLSQSRPQAQPAHSVSSGGSVPLFAPPPAPSTGATSSVAADPQIVVDALHEAERDRSKYFSSHAIARSEIFSAQQIAVLATAFPEYRFRKDDGQARELKRALAALADTHTQYAGMPHAEMLGAVGMRIATLSRAVSHTQAASLQILLGIVASASGTIDWPRVAICEVGLLALAQIRPEVMERLTLARLAHPDTTGGLLDVTCLAGLPVRKGKSRDASEHAAEADDRCWRCGKPWTKAHACTDADILTFVKGQKSRRKRGF